MPRKRRLPKRRAPLPQGLAAVSLCERSKWAVSGPLLAGNVDGPCDHVVPGSDQSLYHVWPSWDTFMQFYEAVRAELFSARPWLRDRSAAECQYAAWLRGEDPDDVDVSVDDPRHLLGGTLAA